MQSSPLGRYLVDADGHTLYLWDDGDMQVTNHRSVVPSAPAATPPIACGVPSLSYGGQTDAHAPLDASVPGRTKGEDIKQFGASWYLLGANGKSIEPDESSAGNGGGNDKSGGGGGY